MLVLISITLLQRREDGFPPVVTVLCLDQARIVTAYVGVHDKYLQSTVNIVVNGDRTCL
jgi:hypothetical protein